MLRKAGYWLIALCVLLSSWAAPAAAAFRDTGGHWAEKAISTWQGYGVVSGYNDAFRPNDPVTRAEFSVMLDKINGVDIRGEFENEYEFGSRVTIKNVVAKYPGQISAEAFLSRDRTKMLLNVLPGWPSYMIFSNESFRVKIVGNNGTTEVKPKEAMTRYQLYPEVQSERPFTEIYLIFENELPEGDLTVYFNAGDIQAVTGINYPEEMEITNIREIAEPGAPSAEYHSSTKTLTLTFADGFVLDDKLPTFLGGLVLMIDGQEWPLRGYVQEPLAPNKLGIPLDEAFWKAIEEGERVELKYSKKYNSVYQIRDATKVLIDNFDSITVLKR